MANGLKISIKQETAEVITKLQYKYTLLYSSMMTTIRPVQVKLRKKQRTERGLPHPGLVD